MASMPFESGSTSSSSPTTESTYHVFLSFRGSDTRKTFLGHLYNALVQAGIYTFKDDKELPLGEEIAPQLSKAIQESRISIVVFSKDYASSRWCLNELVEILECRNTKGITVYPVFYNIDPSHVRKQEGYFKKAFTEFEAKEEKEKITKWRNALKDAANLSGKDMSSAANGDESILIQKIVKDVLAKVDTKNLNIPKHLVGIDSYVNNIINSLSSDDVSIVGIHGMPGTGKTTIAKVAYKNLIHKFEESCFLFDVNEKSKEHHTKVELQKQLLRETLGVNILKRKKISDAESGISLIKDLLGHKRILLVLDDLRQPQQLDTFGGKSGFGKGSKIVFTTTNKKLLTQLKAKKHFVKQWSEETSLKLFRVLAFGEKTPEQDFVKLSKEVVKLCGNSPSALEVMGNRFSQLSHRYEWKREIEELRRVQALNIHFKLKGSYDSLDVVLKSIFLDIACFFVGEDIDFVATILGDRYRYCNNLRNRIQVLKERSLITIDFEDKIRMSSQVQRMGWEIVRQESLAYPGKHSRIWDHKDALDVLNNQMGTEAVEGLTLDELEVHKKQILTEIQEDDLDVQNNQMGSEDVEGRTHHVHVSKVILFLRTESFKEMRFLQLLRIDGVHFTGSFHLLPKGLIWLCWQKFSLKSLPSDFELDNLVALDMQYSYNITELKILNKLKILNLSYSMFATTPNLLGLPSLEELILEGCERLLRVHQSICHLERLVTLNLNRCSRLLFLPFGIYRLSKLETLLVEDCTDLQSISKLPSSLETLDADGCRSLTAIQGIDGLGECDIYLFNTLSLSENFKKSLAEALCKRDDFGICFEGGSVPEWFSCHPIEGSSLSFQVPMSAVSSIGVLRIVVWVVCECKINSSECELGVKISTNDGFWLFQDSISPKSDYCSWVNQITFTDMEGGEELELSVEKIEGHNFIQVNERGFYLIVEKPNVEDEDSDETQETTKEKQDVEEEDDYPAIISYIAHEELHENRETVFHTHFEGEDNETAQEMPDGEEPDEERDDSHDNQVIPTYDERWKNYLQKELPNWDILELTISKQEIASCSDDDEDGDDSDSQGMSSLTSDEE